MRASVRTRTGGAGSRRPSPCLEWIMRAEPHSSHRHRVTRMFIRAVFVRVIRFVARTLVLLVLAIAFRLGARTARAQTLDTGTQLHIRLLDPVSSHSSMRGRAVRALLIAPAPS